MAGFLIGAVCGAGELFLLTRLARYVQNGESLKVLGTVFCKLLLFAAAIVPVTIFLRNEILWCGVGITSTLVLGAFTYSLVRWKKGKGDR